MKTIRFEFTDQNDRIWYMLNSFPDMCTARMKGIDLDPEWGVKVITPAGSDFCMYRTMDGRMYGTPLAKRICTRIWNEYQKTLND